MKGPHIPGMINPYKFGLLGGLANFLQGYGQYQDQQRRFGAQMQLEQMKLKNNQLLKMFEAESRQRAYTVHQVGDDGKPYDVSMRNTLNPATGQWEPQELGRVPSKDPMAATNALIASRQKISSDSIAAANQRSANSIAAANARAAMRNDPSAQTAAERRNQLQQQSLNARAAAAATERDMRTWRKDMDNTQKKQALQGIGSNIDPEKDPAGAAKAYHDAMLAQHKSDLDSGAEKAPLQPGESSSHPDMTPNGQPIKYDGQGNAYIRGPDGSPVPYDPTADTNDSGLALDSPEAQALAQDGSEQTGVPSEDEEDQALLAQNQPQESEDEEPEDEDTESPDEYDRGMLPAGYPPHGPLLNGYQNTEEEQGGLLA